ncbi:MAG: tail assembly protein [Planctomyces sp.]|jgi:predicted phage tail protein
MSLRKIRVYGRLAKFLKAKELEAEISSAADAVRFLLTNWPSLERHMVDQRYRVTVGGYALSEEELGHPSGEQEIRIIPVIGGAGAAGRILAGVALVAASFIPGVGALAINLMLGVGASLVLGGVAQLISPVPTLDGGDDSQGDPRKSYSFSGIQNTSRQGLPIPIVYGEMIVGSIVVSSSIDSDQD